MDKAEITNADMKTAIQYAKDVQAFVLQVLEKEGATNDANNTEIL